MRKLYWGVTFLRVLCMYLIDSGVSLYKYLRLQWLTLLWVNIDSEAMRPSGIIVLVKSNFTGQKYRDKTTLAKKQKAGVFRY